MMDAWDATRSVAENILNRLVNSLSVELSSLTPYSTGPETRLVFEPTEAVTVYYVIAGSGWLTLANGTKVPFAPQSLVIAPARCSLSLGSVDASTAGLLLDHRIPLDDRLATLMATGNSQRYFTLLRGEIVGEFIALFDGAVRLFDLIRASIVHELSTQDPARLTFETMIAEFAKNPVTRSRALEVLLKQLLILVLRRQMYQEANSSLMLGALRDHRLSQTIVAILEEPEKTQRMKSLAAMAGMSRSSFAAQFKDAFGQTPIEFVQAVRLQRAAHLLRTTNLPIKSIASSVGYWSRSHFSRAFRSAYGNDPSAFRQRD